MENSMETNMENEMEAWTMLWFIGITVLVDLKVFQESYSMSLENIGTRHLQNIGAHHFP